MIMSPSHRRNALFALVILALIGIAASGYAIYQHYKIPGESFCNISDYVSCDVVNKSIYSEIAGVPVAVMGAAAYLFLFFISLGLLRAWFKKPIAVEGMLTLFAGAALAFSLYLTFIEFFVLYALCIVCLASQTIILAFFITSLFLWLKDRSRKHLSA